MFTEYLLFNGILSLTKLPYLHSVAFNVGDFVILKLMKKKFVQYLVAKCIN